MNGTTTARGHEKLALLCVLGALIFCTGVSGAAPAHAQQVAAAREPADTTAARSASKRANCGTFWTGWTEDPDTDLNPCPKDCVRGERQLVKTNKKGNVMNYAARYQCYRAATPSQAITTERLAVNGLRPKIIVTQPLQVSGPAPRHVATEALRVNGVRPKLIETPALQVTGKR